MTERRLFFLIFSVVALSILTLCMANGSDVDPTETKFVLNILLSASNELIPSESSCGGNYGQAGRARLKDLLSAKLAYLYKGKNTITGRCHGKGDKNCVLIIKHTAGEDAYSAEIRFLIQRGKIQMSTLTCVITP